MANSKSRRTFFMPLLCRSSLNDTVEPSKFNRSSTADPSSPKLSCIGQIKKRSTATTTTAAAATANNRFLVCSLSDSTTARSTVNSNRYTKLQKLFSGKNLISPAIDTVPINKFTSNKNFVKKRSKSCNDRGRTAISKKKCYISSSDDLDIVRVAVDVELDPPLPVVKCRRRDEESNVNLWKRRGVEMKALQIQPIKLTINRNCSKNNGEFTISTSATTV
ncbi:hypothetical protein SSX86_031449 [Deinandra increscens subsp. villosa]|uniref:Uncharacterized protein n=1 Tax=Deinandra increscens subsp. villosa TaxID=3103831 RepID=A0AAP0C930_9ASTR